jgi:hypothetical protein
VFGRGRVISDLFLWVRGVGRSLSCPDAVGWVLGAVIVIIIRRPYAQSL